LRENIFAFTDAAGYDCYPQYISINREDNGNTSIIVRSLEKYGSTTAEIELTPEQIADLKRAL
jgi:hypothetical protein